MKASVIIVLIVILCIAGVISISSFIAYIYLSVGINREEKNRHLRRYTFDSDKLKDSSEEKFQKFTSYRTNGARLLCAQVGKHNVTANPVTNSKGHILYNTGNVGRILDNIVISRNEDITCLYGPDGYDIANSEYYMLMDISGGTSSE